MPGRFGLKPDTWWLNLLGVMSILGGGAAFVAYVATNHWLVGGLALWCLALGGAAIVRLQVQEARSRKQWGEAEGSGARERPATFADVAGLDEVRADLQEMVSYIRDRQRYLALDAQLPRGILLYGPPGTGKTLLARALAGEAGATFLYASGASFIEKYVGMGSKRVRDLFQRARKAAPAIIFIDEVDSVGRSRRDGENAEWDTTLNQLLTEIDGFSSSDNVLLVAATNRRELLDEALLRPGRLDRQVYIGLPDLPARRAILEVHTRRKPLGADVNLDELARRTPGLSGAHLAAVVNEAALAAARANRTAVTQADLTAGLERVLAGVAGRPHILTADEKRIVAYHEAGHAVVGWVLDTGSIERISMLSRSRALGYVLQIPEERLLHTRTYLTNRICVSLGGRAAEEMMFGDISTGAADDLQKATQVAEAMVLQFGMGRRHRHSVVREQALVLSPTVAGEVEAIIEEAWLRTQQILTRERARVETLAEALLERETLEAAQVRDLLSGEP